MERGTFLTIAVGDYREVREVRMTRDNGLEFEFKLISASHRDIWICREMFTDMSVYRG